MHIKAMAASSRFGCSSLIAVFLLLLSLSNIVISSPLPDIDKHIEKSLAIRDPTSITKERYEAYLKKYFPPPATDRYIFYSGWSEDQVTAFLAKNPSYYWYSSIFNAYTPDHPWYQFFDEERDLDNGESSSQALASLASGQVLVFGAIEHKTEGASSFFTQKEIGLLQAGIRSGRITSINHMVKGATSASQVMATEDADGKFTWKDGHKDGDKNASRKYGVCTEGGTDCDAPQPNPKKPKPESTPESKPSKGMSLSIAMWTGVSPHGTSASTENDWKFYTTKVGQAVGSCGETQGQAIEVKSDDKPAGGSNADPKNPPWPAGIFGLSIEGEACQYKCDGQGAGRLFCPKKEIACREDSMKSKAEGTLKCGSNQFHHAVVYCDF
jgi:hypothetical protein